jgi:hypothetical protein
VRSGDLNYDLVELFGVSYQRSTWATEVGRVLAKHVDRRYGAYVLQRGSTIGGRATWHVRTGEVG